MIALDWEQAFATGHVLAALSALLVGAAVLLLPKGTHTHRVIGTVYVLALVVVDVAALSLHRENTFGVFHVLAVASLVTIAVGLSPLLLGKRSPPVLPPTPTAWRGRTPVWSPPGAANWLRLSGRVTGHGPCRQ